MTNDPRWTDATRDAVARRLFNLDRPSGTDWWAEARHAEAVEVGAAKVRAAAVLAVLADAGLLIEPGGDVREDWTVEVDRGEGWKRSFYIATTGRAPEPVYAADIDGYARGIVKPKRKLRRTVHTGPWQPVETEAQP